VTGSQQVVTSGKQGGDRQLRIAHALQVGSVPVILVGIVGTAFVPSERNWFLGALATAAAVRLAGILWKMRRRAK
jgi:hypothetical protein